MTRRAMGDPSWESSMENDLVLKKLKNLLTKHHKTYGRFSHIPIFIVFGTVGFDRWIFVPCPQLLPGNFPLPV
jgi:hypothetical protein